MITDDEIGSTPPPSSPIPQTYEFPYSPKPEPFYEPETPAVPSQMAAHNWQQRQLYLHYQQYQYHVLQQKLVMSALQLPAIPPSSFGSTGTMCNGSMEYDSHMYCPSPPAVMPVPEPVCARPYLDMSPREASRTYEDTRQHLAIPDTPLKLTSLDASHFGTNITPYPKLKSIPVDISGNLSDAQYNKIFKKYHLHLQLDSHPTMTEQDLEEIKIHGRMYFLKNVKTIVPKVGPWKFNAHISHRRSDERQYNIPGMAVTCKVKEWLTDDGLWRLYHYKRGKTVKVKKSETSC